MCGKRLTFNFDDYNNYTSKRTIDESEQYERYIQYFSNKKIINTMLGHYSTQLKDHFFDFEKTLKLNLDCLLHIGIDLTSICHFISNKFRKRIKGIGKSNIEYCILQLCLLKS